MPATGERDLDGTGNIDLQGFLEIVIALIGAFFRASCSLLVADLNDLIRVNEVGRGKFRLVSRWISSTTPAQAQEPFACARREVILVSGAGVSEADSRISVRGTVAAARSHRWISFSEGTFGNRRR